MNWRPDVFMPHFPRNRVDHEKDRPGCGVVNVPLHQDQVRALAGEVERALWDAAMTGDVRSVIAIVQIVKARVHLNGLEPARDGFGSTSATPRTLVVPPTA
jgi:hypothetical protein